MDEPRFQIERVDSGDGGLHGMLCRAAPSPGQPPLRIRILEVEEPGAALRSLESLKQRLAATRNPAIPPLLSFGLAASGSIYVATPWIEGTPLLSFAAEAPISVVADILQQLAAALAVLHQSGVAHGSLAPSRAIVSAGPPPRLVLHDAGQRALHSVSPPDAARDVRDLAGLIDQVLNRSKTLPAAAQRLADQWQEVSALLLAEGAGASTIEQAARRLRQLADALRAPDSATTQPDSATTQPNSADPTVRRIPAASNEARWESGPEICAPALHGTCQQIVAEAVARFSPARADQRSPAQPAAPRDPLVGRVLGHFRLERRIGAGGMGAVYEAVHIKIQKRAAVKVLSAQLARNREYAARFLNEAKAVNIISHPNLVEIFEFGQEPDGTLFLVMELLNGELLADRLQRSPEGLDRKLALRLAREVADALVLAHQNEIIHRDLKPENLMLVRDVRSGLEHAKILDFGIAKVKPRSLDPDAEEYTEIGRIMGSPEYMAPEQFGQAGAVTGRADVFALGLVLCVLLSGHLPYSGNSLSQIQSDKELKLPQRASQALQGFLRRMLAFDPEQRPLMTEVVSALEQELRPQRGWLLPVAVSIPVVLVIAAAVRWLVVPDPLAGLQRYRDIQPLAERVLEEGVRSQNQTVRRLSLRAVGTTRRADLFRLLVPPLAAHAQGGARAGRADREELLDAVFAAGELGTEEARPYLEKLAAPPLESPIAAASAGVLCLQGWSARCRELGAALPKLKAGEQHAAARMLCAGGDESGCQVLRVLTALPSTVSLEVLDAWSLLARRGDEQAVQKLRAQGQDATNPLLKLGALSKLVGLRGPAAASATAMKELEETAGSAHDGALIAAVLCAQLHRPAGRALLLEALANGRQTPLDRAQIAAALAELGQLEIVGEPLVQTLRAEQEPIEVRIAAAAALLRLLGASQQGLRAQNLSRLTSAQTAASWLSGADEESVAGALPADESERRIVLFELRNRRTQRAIDLLVRALDEPSLLVRGEALRSLLRLRQGAQRADRERLDERLRGALLRLEQGTTPAERVLTAVLRLRLGVKSQNGSMGELQDRNEDPAIRELIVGFLDPKTEHELLLAALKDDSFAVRFRAACLLAEAGSDAGQVVLREALRLQDGRALIAYEYLRQLGRLGGLGHGLDFAALLVGEQQLWVRFQATLALQALPPDEALPLLRQNLSDPAATIRTATASLTAEFFARTKDRRFLELLLLLRGDEDAAVRWRAERILAAYLGTPQTPTAPPVPSAPSPSPAVDAVVPREPKSPADLSRQPPRDLGAQPHDLSRRNQTIPPPPALPKVDTGPGDRLAEKAQEFERKHLIPDAMNKWQSILDLPGTQRSQQIYQQARAAVARLRAELASYERTVAAPGGQCRPEGKKTWVFPGLQSVSCGTEVRRIKFSQGEHKSVSCCP